jgi:hypothetical protein
MRISIDELADMRKTKVGVGSWRTAKFERGGWLEFLANEPAVPFGSTLRTHFDVSTITRLCECGCNSFDEIPEAWSWIPPRRQGDQESSSRSSTNRMRAEVAFLIFVDSRGYLAGIDVTCGDGNHAQMPDDVRLGRVTYAE